MNSRSSLTLLRIPLIRERYAGSFLASIGIHILAVLLVLFGGYLFPRQVVQIGSGLGGGMGGDISTVGVIDELSGGTGMVKPSVVPKPPALLEEPPPVDRSKAVPIPQTIEPRKKKPAPAPSKPAPKPPSSNVIPTAPEPGSGGTGGRGGGSGGGFGGGIGVSIGSGTGGFGDHWYARVVEARISSNWTRPPEGVRVEVIFSFDIASDGTIRNIKKEKSSGNAVLDLRAEGAIRSSNPLSAPPPEFRGRLIRFMAHFVYPPNQ